MTEKSEKTSLVQKARDWGQVVLIACAIGGGALTFVSKAWGWALSGPAALTKADKLEKEVRRIKRQSRFTVKVLEKIGREKYDWRGEERDITREETE